MRLVVPGEYGMKKFSILPENKTVILKMLVLVETSAGWPLQRFIAFRVHDSHLSIRHVVLPQVMRFSRL